ncbi:hypothetical protein NMG60_11020542 [Bertholletia excelsa]
MDSNTSGYLLNHTALHSVYYQSREDESMIELGLSLRALQPEAYHPSGHDDHSDLMDWNEWNPELKRSKMTYSRKTGEDYDDETKGVRWTYVKVNMDGVIVGRKICILDHMGYSTLAMQLEDMFGRQTISGLRLFQTESEYSLFYKDTEENWRKVGDIPWKEFVDSVQRLRIVPKNEVLAPSSSAVA